jgi:hypothetical protein
MPSTIASSRTAVAAPEACPCSCARAALRLALAIGAQNSGSPAPIMIRAGHAGRRNDTKLNSGRRTSAAMWPIASVWP